MPVYVFTVPGDPVPWKRARRAGNRYFTDPSDAAHRDKIKAYARNAGVRKPLLGPVGLEVKFVKDSFAFPEAHSVGDLDNLVKGVKDALQGVAFEDDCQIVHLTARKICDPEYPRTEVRISGDE